MEALRTLTGALAAVVVSGAVLLGTTGLLVHLGQECFGEGGQPGLYCTGPLGSANEWIDDNYVALWAASSAALIAVLQGVRHIRR